MQTYTLTNAGLEARILDFGAVLVSLAVPDRRGRPANVVLGYDVPDDYRDNPHHLGGTIGRFANRIAGAGFTLDGRHYRLAANSGANHLHGGIRGFDHVPWRAEPAAGGRALRLHYLSRDGEEGYPGNLAVEVTYSLTDDGALRIDYAATTDRPTPVNLTHHSYFNLAGGGDVGDHELWIDADQYLPADATLVPTGERAAVDGTPLDFRQPRPVGRSLGAFPDGPPYNGGFDHCYVLKTAAAPALAARVHEPGSGRILEVHTTEPALQLYTANWFDGRPMGAGGAVFPRFGALCLEAQQFPDAVHHRDFPDAILRPGMRYRQTTLYRFSAR
ncbi:MAG: galactose mutarotase [Pseudomonadota bacterium]|nr:galactose mutarotase [Pseudomonadota bacterium]